MESSPNHDFGEPVIDDRVAEIMRKKTPSERLEIAFGMWRSVRDMIARVVESQNPGWTPDQIRRETARRMSHGAV
jgi:hypothetical protein